MKSEIILSTFKSFKWFNLDQIFFIRGYIYNKFNTFYNPSEVYALLKSALDNEKLLFNTVKQLNGSFLIIIKWKDELIIISDRIRTFPLFYFKSYEKIVISDKCESIINSGNFVPDESLIDEILVTGFVNRGNTIFKEINQINAGEIIRINKSGTDKKFYYYYKSDNKEDFGLNYYQKKFAETFNNVGDRFISNLNGRQLVIPLSGGYDSRLIANMAFLKEYKNVLCYTYGGKDSYEKAIASKVANNLGFKWRFIDYNSSLINGFSKSEIFSEYVKFSSNYSVIPHIQDYFALIKLIDNKEIDHDAIIAPGLRCPFYIYYFKAFNPDLTKFDKDACVKQILKLHYQFKNNFKNEIAKDKIKENLCEGMVFEQLDDWEMKESESKFIINSVRLFEYFDFEHRLPLLDNEFIDFFVNQPLNYRINNHFYHSESINQVFKLTNTDFSSSAYTSSKNYRLIDEIKKMKFIRLIFKIFGKYLLKKYSNPNNFHLVIKELMPEGKIKGNVTNWYNGNIAKWYVENYSKW